MGWKRFLLPVTYFPTNLAYPFSLRVTGIFIRITSSPICRKCYIFKKLFF